MRYIVTVVLVLWPAMGLAQGVEQARALLVSGDYAEARRVAQRVLERAPCNDEALRILVATSCSLGDAPTAREAFASLTPAGRDLALRHCALAGIDLLHDARRPWRIAAWSGLAVTVAALSTGVLFALQASSWARQKDDLLERYASSSSGPSWVRRDDACAAAQSAGAQDVTDICERGTRSATAANVMYGVSAGLAVATGYLYYRAYRRPERARFPVSVQPSLAASGGGLSVRLGF